jgi:hypothetical protein
VIDATHHEELVYTDITLSWGRNIILLLDKVLESRNGRYVQTIITG